MCWLRVIDVHSRPEFDLCTCDIVLHTDCVANKPHTHKLNIYNAIVLLHDAIDKLRMCSFEEQKMHCLISELGLWLRPWKCLTFSKCSHIQVSFLRAFLSETKNNFGRDTHSLPCSWVSLWARFWYPCSTVLDIANDKYLLVLYHLLLNVLLTCEIGTQYDTDHYGSIIGISLSKFLERDNTDLLYYIVLYSYLQNKSLIPNSVIAELAFRTTLL